MEENNNFLYNGYLLVINHHSWCHWWSECKELEYYCTSSSIPFLKNCFKQFIDEKLEKEKEMNKDTFSYKGFTVDIIPLGINPTYGMAYEGQCKELSYKSLGHFRKGDLIEEVMNVINKKLEGSKTVEDKDKKIEELVKVISGLNKKLEEKDNKIERLKEFEKENLFLKKKLDTIRIEIWKKAE